MASTDRTPDEGANNPANGPGGHGPPADLDYEILRLIGKGGYGEVWLVRDKQGEYRACKVVYRESFDHDRPYEREYEGIRNFEPVSRASESQVKILYVGRRDAAGYFFYIMELADDVDGGPLVQPGTYVPKSLKSELEHKGRLPADECIRIGVSLSGALENLHQHGLIHRDIKPANIIFVNGVPKLADIGLVTEADVTVSYVGTGGFIPPEGPGSPPADVYALGKVLYEISTGKDRLEYPELPGNFGDLPDRAALLELNSVVARACEADARKRYVSAAELYADLMLLREGKSIRQTRPSRVYWTIAALLAILALTLLVVLGKVYLGHKPTDADAVLPPKPPVVQIPLPDAALTAQSEAKVKDTYRIQLTGGTSAARQQAAFELVEQSGMATDPPTQLASLRVASLLAMEAGNFQLATQICDRMAERFRMNSLPAKVDLLTQASGESQAAAKRADLTERCIQTGFEAIAADDYDDGAKVTALAKALAQNTADARLTKEAEFLDREMTRCREGYERVRQFEDVLRNQPADPEANLAVGKFLCFTKNDWETGLPLMAHATNELLKTVVATEINEKPKTADQQIALADLWKNLVAPAGEQDKTGYQQRARHWYLKGIATASEPEKTRLQSQLNEWLQATPTEPGEVHIIARFDGNEVIDIYGDEIRWKSVHRAIDSRINHVLLGDLKAGDLKIIKNSGATRLLPEAVDFSTARLIVVRKPKKQERAKLEIAPDHVRVTLIRPRPGFAEMEATVVFGNRP